MAIGNEEMTEEEFLKSHGFSGESVGRPVGAPPVEEPVAPQQAAPQPVDQAAPEVESEEDFLKSHGFSGKSVGVPVGTAGVTPAPEPPPEPESTLPPVVEGAVSIARHGAAGVGAIVNPFMPVVKMGWRGVELAADKFGLEGVADEARVQQHVTGLAERQYERGLERVRGKGSEVFNEVSSQEHESFGDYATAVKDAIVDDPAGFARWMLETGAETAPQVVAAMTSGRVGASAVLSLDKVAKMAPGAAKAVAGLGGIAGSSATMFPLELGGITRRMEEETGKIDYKHAVAYAALSSVVESFTETGVAMRTLIAGGKHKAAQELGQKAIKTWRQALKATGKGAFSEGMEESTQQVLENTFVNLSKDEADRDPWTAMTLASGTIESFLGGMGPGGFISSRQAIQEKRGRGKKLTRLKKERAAARSAAGEAAPTLPEQDARVFTQAEVEEAGEVPEGFVPPPVEAPKAEPNAIAVTGEETAGKPRIVKGGIDLTEGVPAEETERGATPVEEPAEPAALEPQMQSLVTDGVEEVVEAATTVPQPMATPEEAEAARTQEGQQAELDFTRQKDDQKVQTQQAVDQSKGVVAQTQAAAKAEESQAKIAESQAKQGELFAQAELERAKQGLPPAKPAAAPAAPVEDTQLTLPGAGVAPAAEALPSPVADAAGVTPVAAEGTRLKTPDEVTADEKLADFQIPANMEQATDEERSGLRKQAFDKLFDETDPQKGAALARILDTIDGLPSGTTAVPDALKPMPFPSKVDEPSTDLSRAERVAESIVLRGSEAKLRNMKREKLEDVAKDLDIDPADYKNKRDLAKAVHGAAVENAPRREGVEAIPEEAAPPVSSIIGDAAIEEMKGIVKKKKGLPGPKAKEKAALPSDPKKITSRHITDKTVGQLTEDQVRGTGLLTVHAIADEMGLDRTRMGRPEIEEMIIDRLAEEEESEAPLWQAGERGETQRQAEQRAERGGPAIPEAERVARTALLGRKGELTKAKEALRRTAREVVSGITDPKERAAKLKEEYAKIDAVQVADKPPKGRLAKMAESLAAGLGKKVVWLKPNQIGGGFFSPTNPDVIFLSERIKGSNMFSVFEVALHEIKHNLDFEGKTDTEVAAIIMKFNKAIAKAAGKDSQNFKEWAAGYKSETGQPNATDELLWSEYTAEIFQDAARRPEFYDSLQKNDPAFFDAVVDGYRRVVQWLYSTKLGKSIFDKALDQATIDSLLTQETKMRDGEAVRISGVEAAEVFRAVSDVLTEYRALKMGDPQLQLPGVEVVAPAKKKVGEKLKAALARGAAYPDQPGESGDVRRQLNKLPKAATLKDTKFIDTKGVAYGGGPHATSMGGEEMLGKAIRQGVIRVKDVGFNTGLEFGQVPSPEQRQTLVDRLDHAKGMITADIHMKGKKAQTLKFPKGTKSHEVVMGVARAYAGVVKKEPSPGSYAWMRANLQAADRGSRTKKPTTQAEFDKNHTKQLQEDVHPDVLKVETPSVRFSRNTLEEWRIRTWAEAKAAGWTDDQVYQAIKDAEYMAQIMAKHEHLIPKEVKVGKYKEPIRTNSFETPLGLSIDYSGVCPKSAKEQAYIGAIMKEMVKAGHSPHIGRLETLMLNQRLKDKKLKASCRTCYVLQKIRDRMEMGRAFFDWTRKDFEEKAAEKGYPSTFLVGMGGSGRKRVADVFKSAKVDEESREGKKLKAELAKRDEGFLKDLIASSTKGSIDDRDVLLSLLKQLGYDKREMEHAFAIEDMQYIEQDPRLETLYQLYSTYVGGAKASKVFPDVFSAYTAEILDFTSEQVEKANRSRGLRISGFTDVEGFSMLDLAQTIIHSAMKGLHVYQYTKVPEVAVFLADTGVKMNLSMFLKTNKDGSVTWDEVDGMTVNDMRALVALNPDDIGAMVVALDDAQIQWGLDNPEIGLVIPNHIMTTEKDMFGRVGVYDYTTAGAFKSMPVKEMKTFKGGKNKGKTLEVVKSKGKDVGGEMYAKYKKEVYFKYWQEKFGYDKPKQAADAMMKFFNDKGVLLPFQEAWGHHPNFYKTLTDFAAIGKAQGVVKANFRMDAFDGLWSKYVKEGGARARTWTDPKITKEIADEIAGMRTRKGTQLTIEKAIEPGVQLQAAARGGRKGKVTLTDDGGMYTGNDVGVYFLGADLVHVDKDGNPAPTGILYPDKATGFTLKKGGATAVANKAEETYKTIAIVGYKNLRSSMDRNPLFHAAIERAVVDAYGPEVGGEMMSKGKADYDAAMETFDAGRKALQDQIDIAEADGNEDLKSLLVKRKKAIKAPFSAAHLAMRYQPKKDEGKLLPNKRRVTFKQVSEDIAAPGWQDMLGNVVGIGRFKEVRDSAPGDIYPAEVVFENYYKLPTPVPYEDIVRDSKIPEKHKGSAAWVMLQNAVFAMHKRDNPVIRSLIAAGNGDMKVLDKLTDGMQKGREGLPGPKARLQAAGRGDAAYMKAVEAGDMKTAQKMVDEAAKKAGFNIGHVYHGTMLHPSEFTSEEMPFHIFNIERSELGAHFGVHKGQSTTDENVPVGKRTKVSGFPTSLDKYIYSAHIKAKNPIRLVDKGSWGVVNVTDQLVELGKMTKEDRNTILHGNAIGDSAKSVWNPQRAEDWLRQWFAENKYDSVIYINRREIPGGVHNFKRMEKAGVKDDSDLTDAEYKKIVPEAEDSYMVFSPTQIKSADPVTYDDKGNVIPLSKRFDTTTPDIRFQTAERGRKKRVKTVDIPDTEASWLLPSGKFVEAWEGHDAAASQLVGGPVDAGAVDRALSEGNVRVALDYNNKVYAQVDDGTKLPSHLRAPLIDLAIIRGGKEVVVNNMDREYTIWTKDGGSVSLQAAERGRKKGKLVKPPKGAVNGSTQEKYLDAMVAAGYDTREIATNLFVRWHKEHGKVSKHDEIRIIDKSGRAVGGKDVYHADIFGSQEMVDEAIALGFVRVRADKDKKLGEVNIEVGSPLTEPQRKLMMKHYGNWFGTIVIDAYTKREPGQLLSDRSHVPIFKPQMIPPGDAWDELFDFYSRGPKMGFSMAAAWRQSAKRGEHPMWPERIEQEIKSEKTSRLQEAGTFKMVDRLFGWTKGTTNADIGGGKFNLGTALMKKFGVKNLVYDPFNRSAKHNKNVIKQIADGGADTATVNNVLNVIKEQGNRNFVIGQAYNAVKPGGTAYFITYEGKAADREKGARETKDGWQNFRMTETYEPEIEAVFGGGNVTRKGKLIIAKKPTAPEAQLQAAARGKKKADKQSQLNLFQKLYTKGTSPRDISKALFNAWHASHGENLRPDRVRFTAPDGRVIGHVGPHADIMGSPEGVAMAVTSGYIRLWSSPYRVSDKAGGAIMIGETPTDAQYDSIRKVFETHPGNISVDAYADGTPGGNLAMREREYFRKEPYSRAFTFDRMMQKIRDFYSGKQVQETSSLLSYLQAANRGNQAQPGLGTYWSMLEPTKVTNLVRKFQNRHIDTKDAIWSIQNVFGDMDDDINIDKQQKTFLSKVKDALDVTHEDEIMPILSKMQEHGETLKSAGEYLVMRRVPEYNALIARRNPAFKGPGSGIKDSEAADYMNTLDPARVAGLDEIADMFDAFKERTHQLMIATHLEHPDTIKAWEAENPSWISFQREGADDFMPKGTGVGQGFDVRGTMGKVAAGSDLKINPEAAFASLIAVRERVLKRGLKNLSAGHATYAAAIKYPNPDFWKAIRPKDTHTPAGLDKLADELADLWNMSRDEIKNMFNEPEVAVWNPSTKMIEYKISRRLREAPNVFVTRVNGEDRYVFFNPRNERAVLMARALKNQDIDPMLKGMSLMAKFTRVYAALSTQWNPFFGIKNFGRDALEAMVTLKATPLEGHKRKVFTKLPAALWANVKAERYKRHPSGTPPDSTLDKLQRRFTKAGGPTGHLDYFEDDRQRAVELAKNLQNLYNREGGGTKAALTKLMDSVKGWLTDYNTAMENATRLATFAVAHEQGLSDLNAAILAKEVTVNFNDKGYSTANYNALYAFFNASVQGSATVMRTLTERKSDGSMKLSKTGAEVLAGGLILGAMQSVMLMMMGTGDDDPPEFVRDKNFVIYNPFSPNHPFMIPMPLGFQFIPALGRRSVELVASGFEDVPQRMISLTEMALSSANPLGEVNTGMNMAVPTPAKPVFQLMQNKDWKGQPIYREDFNTLKTTPGWTRARDTASFWAKYIAMAVDRLSGGDGVLPGYWSPSPDQLDFLVGAYAGGVGREVAKTGAVINSIAEGNFHELPMYKVPVAGVYVGTVGGPTVDRAHFYRNLKQAYDHQAQIKHHKSKGTLKEYYAENPVARKADTVVRLKSKIDKLRKFKKAAKASGNTDRAATLEENMRNLMARANEMMESDE